MDAGILAGRARGAQMSGNELSPALLYGYKVVEEKVAARLLRPGAVVNLSDYLDGVAGHLGTSSVVDLLGAYKSADSVTNFRNGSPSAISTLLYWVAFSGLAADLYHRKPGLPLQPGFETLLGQVGRWPREEAKADALLEALWLQVMGFAAPAEEFRAWRDFFRQSSYARKAGAETVPVMLATILMNPFFLLRS